MSQHTGQHLRGCGACMAHRAAANARALTEHEAERKAAAAVRRPTLRELMIPDGPIPDIELNGVRLPGRARR